MYRHWIALLTVAGFVGCLSPRYSVGTDGSQSAAGSSGQANDSGATNGGSATSGSSSGGNAPNGGSTDQTMGGDPSTAGTGTMTPGDCKADQKLCDGACVAIDDVTYGCTATSCNQSACPVNVQSLACNKGECVIGSCEDGSKQCGGRCVSVNDPTYGCSATGCEPSSCPDPQGSTLVCDAGVCKIGTCGAGTKKCNSKCVPLDAPNGCAATDRCDACAAGEICSGSPSKCTCVPDDPCSGLACGSAKNRCGTDVDCQDKCSAQGLVCNGNQCAECNLPADCPSIVCAKAACTNHQCTYSASTGTACTGGTCSNKLGICSRPQVTVGNFKIDATEVTRGQYLAFLTAKNGSTAGQAATCSWNTSFVPPKHWPPALKEYELPVNYVDWCDAVAYCSWAGGRLCGAPGGGKVTGSFDDPSASQWMKACSGAQGNAFPYGNTWQQATCNVDEIAPVASFPGCTGGYPGLYDMSGNVQEWEDNCSNQYCYLRGSNYDLGILDGGDKLKCGAIGQIDEPTVTHERVGIRCCSNP